MNDDQRRRLREGKMRFVPGPDTVFVVPLNIGFVGKKEQTGHPAQKPLKVIEPLIMMSTVPGDIVVDPMCGCGGHPATVGHHSMFAICGLHFRTV